VHDCGWTELDRDELEKWNWSVEFGQLWFKYVDLKCVDVFDLIDERL
jgi:hypothetical protein